MSLGVEGGLAAGLSKFEPPPGAPPVPHRPRDLSQLAHRRVIGYLGLMLPVLLFALAGLRPIPGVERWSLLSSVSSYYYTAHSGIRWSTYAWPDVPDRRG